MKGCEEENESEDEEGVGKNGKGMVEEDSDLFVDSGELLDVFSDEEDDVNVVDM